MQQQQHVTLFATVAAWNGTTCGVH